MSNQKLVKEAYDNIINNKKPPVMDGDVEEERFIQGVAWTVAIVTHYNNNHPEELQGLFNTIGEELYNRMKKPH